MELKDRVTSNSLSLELKNLGIKQEISPGDAYWVKLSNGKWRLFFQDEGEDSVESSPYEWCRAFSVAELGELIGKESFHTYRNAGTVLIDVPFDKEFVAETEADARAKLVIYLMTKEKQK